MADPVGVTLGAASLAIQLLDGAVKGESDLSRLTAEKSQPSFTFFLAVGDMEASCLHFRTQLEIEQRRILNFAEAANILDFIEEGNVPLILRKEHLVLVAVFIQIENKLADLATFTERYNQLQYKQLQSSGLKVDQLDIKQQYSALVSWEKAAERRAAQRSKSKKYIRGTNHIVKYYKIGEKIISDPKRLRWTAIDQKVFEATLTELASYNNFLEGLLAGDYAKRLDERTQKTYLEIVLVRDEVEDLKRLLVNALLLSRHIDNGLESDSKHSPDVHPLTILAGTKLASVLNDDSHKTKPPAYEEVIKDSKIMFSMIEDITEIPKPEELPRHRKRSTAQLKSSGANAECTSVFIEWKAYSTTLDEKTNRDVPQSSSIDRANGLVTLLQHSKLDAFRTPKCKGWFDLREGDSKHPPLLGIVYENLASGVDAPEALLTRLASHPKPSLGARMRLAYAISDSVLYFNSVNWFHKALRSDAVLFAPNEDSTVDITKPFLAGFEYSRPDKVAGKTTHPSQHPENELYVHPDYQGSSAGGGYARSYDVYALGIVLLETAYCMPIKSLLKEEFTNPDAGPIRQDAHAVRKILLGQRPSKKSYLEDLKGMVGDKYYKAVDGCIRGFVGDEENEKQIEVTVRLHEAFVRDVVGALASLGNA